jgi:macrolide-specific efflux system membrane fusion protein
MDEKSKSKEKDFSVQFMQNRKKRRQRRLGLFLVAVLAVGGYYYWTSQQTGPVAEDETLIVTVGYGNIENAIPSSGKLQPKEVVPIGARASGELVEIMVEVGDVVEEGQIVALIDPEEQELRVESSRLSLQNQQNQLPQRELDLRLAESNMQRTQMLYDAEASTEQEYENAEKSLLNAEISLANLKISIQQSQTSLAQEEVQLRYTEVRAPMSGTIISLDQKEGATLNASQTAPTVMQIADLTTLTVETEISEADIQALETGVDVYFTTLGSGDRRWTGSLDRIDPIGKESNNVVLFTGRFDVDNADEELFPNMTTQVFFVTSHAENVLTVPLGALTFVGGSGAGGPNGGAQMTGGRQGMPNEGAMAAGRGNFPQNGEITPEMRAQFEQRGGGSFDGASGRGGGGRGGRGGGGFPGGGGGFPGGGGGFPNEGSVEGDTGPTVPQLSGAIALNLPRAATVQVVRDDDTFETREIMVGAQDRVNAEVISGLEAGDRVVAGVIQARIEEEGDSSNNRNNNNWRGGGGGMFF